MIINRILPWKYEMLVWNYYYDENDQPLLFVKYENDWFQFVQQTAEIYLRLS